MVQPSSVLGLFCVDVRKQEVYAKTLPHVSPNRALSHPDVNGRGEALATVTQFPVIKIALYISLLVYIHTFFSCIYSCIYGLAN